MDLHIKFLMCICIAFPSKSTERCNFTNPQEYFYFFILCFGARFRFCMVKNVLLANVLSTHFTVCMQLLAYKKLVAKGEDEKNTFIYRMLFFKFV